MPKNEMTARFSALSQNEALARVIVGAFASQMNPTLSEVADIKTAVSEAVTNAIIHAFRGKEGFVELNCAIDGDTLSVTVRDDGRGISDIAQARTPFYTTCPGDDRSGMGFTVMETFMTTLDVESSPNAGTTIRMTKRIGAETDGEAKA